MNEEFFQFCQYCFTQQEVNVKFIILSTSDHQALWTQIEERKLPKQAFWINKVSKQEVPSYLSAADFGFCGVRPIPSQRYSSPIKDGEYWACGLPVIIPRGISDDHLFAQEHNLGILIEELDNQHLEKTVQKVIEWQRKENAEEVRKRCRNFVQKDRNVDTYKQLYANIFEQL